MSVHTKLIVVAAIAVGTTAYMAYVGASTNWQYYLSVEECKADADTLVGTRLRVSGRVAADSLDVADTGMSARFRLLPAGKDDGPALDVTCRGPLPDNFAEGIDVVVEGTLHEEATLRGDKVITRCASKYERAGQ